MSRSKLFQHDHGGAVAGRSAHHHHSLPHVQGQQGEPGKEVLLETAYDLQDLRKKECFKIVKKLQPLKQNILKRIQDI